MIERILESPLWRFCVFKESYLKYFVTFEWQQKKLTKLLAIRYNFIQTALVDFQLTIMIFTYFWIPYSINPDMVVVRPPAPPIAAPIGINKAETPNVVNINPNPTILTMLPEKWSKDALEWFPLLRACKKNFFFCKVDWQHFGQCQES